MANKITSNCNGYGTHHGDANGRHWFSCPRCRWCIGKPAPLPETKAQKQARLVREHYEVKS